MKNKDSAMTFVESEKKKTCFLSAKTVTTKFVGNINHDSNDYCAISEVETKTTDGIKLLQYDYDEFHDEHGHHSDAKLRSLAKKLGFKLAASIKTCDARGLTKAKAKPIPKVTKRIVTEVGEYMVLCVTSPFPLTGGKHHQEMKHKLFWYGFDDHFSTKMISALKDTKSELVDFAHEACVFMKARCTPIQTVRMDDASSVSRITSRLNTLHHKLRN